MHYRSLLRVLRRDRGIRIYAVHEHAAGPDEAGARAARIDALVDVIVRAYAPLPGPSLSFVVRRLRYAVPQWQRDVGSALRRATAVRAFTGGRCGLGTGRRRRVAARGAAGRRSLLAPFDPVVWDRRRFEIFCGPTGSRPTHRCPSASAGTTRSRCSGATGRSGGAMCQSRTASCRPASAMSTARRVRARSRAHSTPRWSACGRFSACGHSAVPGRGSFGARGPIDRRVDLAVALAAHDEADGRAAGRRRHVHHDRDGIQSLTNLRRLPGFHHDHSSAKQSPRVRRVKRPCSIDGITLALYWATLRPIAIQAIGSHPPHERRCPRRPGSPCTSSLLQCG